MKRDWAVPLPTFCQPLTFYRFAVQCRFCFVGGCSRPVGVALAPQRDQDSIYNQLQLDQVAEGVAFRQKIQ